MLTVLCHGCFDLVHFGHLKHLEAAKALGDRLIVSVTSDEYVNKGPDRPRFKLRERMEMLSALRIVDLVLASDAPTPEAVIRFVRPDYYVKGVEYRGRLPEQKLVESFGGVVVFQGYPVYSSTELLKAL